MADEFHRRLIKWINEFHRSLDEDHEVGAGLVSFGKTVTIHIDDIGYWNPSLISFQGINENGEAVKLIQQSLIRLPQEQQEVIRRRIYGGQTFAVIAEQMHLPLGTVLTWMRRGLLRLREDSQLRAFVDEDR